MTIRRIETQDCESITNSSSSHSTGYVERKGSPQSDRIAEPYIRNTGLRIESEFHSSIASIPNEPTGLSIRRMKTQDCESIANSSSTVLDTLKATPPQSDRIAELYIRNTGLRIKSEFPIVSSNTIDVLSAIRCKVKDSQGIKGRGSQHNCNTT